MARSGEERCGENNNRPVRPSVPVPPPSVCVIFAETGKLSSEGRGEPRGACSPPESPRCLSLTGADGFVRLGISPGRRGKERLQQRWWQAGGGGGASFLLPLPPPTPRLQRGCQGTEPSLGWVGAWKSPRGEESTRGSVREGSPGWPEGAAVPGAMGEQAPGGADRSPRQPPACRAVPTAPAFPPSYVKLDSSFAFSCWSFWKLFLLNLGYPPVTVLPMGGGSSVGREEDLWYGDAVLGGKS